MIIHASLATFTSHPPDVIPRDEARPSPFFVTLLHLCIILNTNRRIKNRGGLGTRLPGLYSFYVIWQNKRHVQCIIVYPNLDYPNAKFHKPHPHLQKPCGLWQLQNLAKWYFPIVKAMQSAENVLIIKEKLDICKAHGYK